MANESHQDPLESFFRKELGGYAEDPGDELWGKIEAAVPPPRKAWWPFWLLLLLFPIGISVYFVWQNLEHRETIRNQQGVISELKEQLQNRKAAQETIKSDSNIPVVKETIAPVSAIRVFTKPSHFPIGEKKEQKTAIVPTSTNEKKPVLRRKTLLPFTWLETTNDSLKSDQRFRKPAVALMEREKSLEFYYGAFVESGAVWSAASGALNKPLYTQAGILVGLRFNRRWSLETGLGFSQYRFRWDAGHELQYPEVPFSVEDNMALIRYTLTDENAFIELEPWLNNELKNDGEDLTAFESFSLQTNLDYRISYYTIPLWLRYQSPVMGKLNWTLKAGGRIQSVFGEQIRSLEVVPGFPRLSPKFEEVKIRDLEGYFIELGFGLGLSYEISPRLDLKLEPSLYKAITKRSVDRPLSAGIQASINYHF